MASQDQLIELARASKRAAGKCLGFANNDVVSALGTIGSEPGSAQQAFNALLAKGQAVTTECPDYPHVDFYKFGVDGHIDWHLPQRGIHVADSSRTTVKLNASGTVGTYASYSGGPRQGWANIPAVGASISIVNDVVVAPPAPTAPAKPVPQTVGAVWETNPPSEAVQKRIQVALAKRGRYSGPENGVFGENTWRGIQFTVSVKNGNTYIGLVNGIPGKLTCIAIQTYAKKYGGYTGPINAILGPNTWEGFARGLEKGL
jgi:hypothetical protein